MNKFTFYDSAGNLTGKTKQWLGWLAFCGVLLLGQIGFAFLMPKFKETSKNDLVSTEVQTNYVAVNNTLQVTSANADDDDDSVDCSQISSSSSLNVGWALGGANLQELAGDFVVAAGTTFDFETLKVSVNTASTTSFDVFIWSDNNNLPNAVLYTITGVTSTNPVLTSGAYYMHTLDISSENISFAPMADTRYWVQITTTGATSWERRYNDGALGVNDAYRQNSGAWYTIWTDQVAGQYNLVYEVIGECTGCPTSFGLTATQVSTESATINWSNFSGNLSDIQWGAAGFALGSGTIVTGLTPPYAITGLTLDEEYDVYIKCADGNDWIGPVSFTILDIILGCDIVLNIGYTSWGDAVTWQLLDGSGTAVLSGGPYGGSSGGYSDTQTTTFLNPPYTLNIVSTLGDNGAVYSITVGGDQDISGSSFGNFNISVPLNAISCPVCPAPTSLAVSNLTYTTADLTWTGGGGDYEVEWGLSGFDLGTGTMVTPATSPVELIGLTGQTSYQFYVREYCGVDDGYSVWAGPYTFYTDYCAAATQWTGDNISSFETSGAIVNISNTNNGSAPTGYDNFTNFAVQHFESGETEFTVTTQWSMNVNIWIDWNNNMIFDTDELVYQSTNQQQIHTALITVPTGTPLGDYRIRIRGGYNWDGNFGGPCGTAQYGETEDYTFTVITPPTCMPPTQLGANINSLTEAELYWTSEGTLFEVEYGIQGFTLGTGTSVTEITSNSTVLSDLTPNTYHHYYVRRDCGDGDLSPWTGPYTFYTNYCAATSQYQWDYISSFSTSGAITNITNNSGGFSPNGYGDFTDMSVSHFETGEVSFTVAFNSWFGVNIWIDWNNNMVFEESEKVYASGINSNISFSGMFSVPAGQALGDYRMRVRGDNGSSNPSPCGTIFYGETEDYTFTVIPTPTCMPPTQLGANINSLTEAELYWTSDGTLFEVEYGMQGFTLGTGISVTGITTNNIILSDLTPNTYHHYFVRRDCGDGDLSPWTGPYTFYTNYCEATTQWTGDNITLFAAIGIGLNIDNPTGGSPNGYGNYTAMTVSHFETGQVDFTVTTNWSSLDVNMWIDWNNNMVFDEDELVASFMGSNTYTGSFSIPVGTPVGDYRIRIRAATSWNGPVLPCGTSQYGETEDYTLTVIPTPTCMPPTQLGANINTLTEAELYWTSVGDLFEVEYGAQGFSLGTGTSVTGITTNNTILSDLTPNTYYQYYIRRDCGDGDLSPWTGPYTFYTNYCEATTQWTGDNISSFETSGAIVNISNTNNGGSPNGYGNFTNYAVQHFETGEAEFIVTTQWNMNVSIWIDWNNNMIFDTDELVYQSTNQQQIHTALISVPTGAPLGDYRIRIRAGYNWDGNFGGPCGTINYGETEDYTFTVITPPTCMPPTQLGANINTLTEAELYWTSEGTLFEIEYGMQGFTLGTGTSVTGITTNNTILSDLTPNTYHHYFIRRDCGDGDLSPWTGPYLFYTNYCQATSQNTWDHITSFTTSGGIPFDISNTNSGASPNGYGNFTDMSVHHFETGQVDFTITTNWTGLNVNMWIDWNNNMVFDADELIVSFTGSYTGSFLIPIGTPIGDYRIRIRAGSSSPCGTINNGETEDYTLTVITPPDCLPPFVPIAVNASATSVLLSWQADGDLFDIEYGPTGFTPGEGITISGVGNPYLLGPLTAGVAYDYYVRQDCNANDDGYSTWNGPVTFTPGVFGGTIPTLLNDNPQVEDIACATSFAIDVPEGQFLASLTVDYIMTSASPALDSHQRSVLYSSTLGMGETAVALPPNPQNYPGVVYYSRSVNFANGATGTIEFELKAWRTEGGSGCGTALVYVEDGSWVLNATFEDIPTCPNPPASLAYTNITEDSVDLIWTSEEDGTFQVKWGAVGFNVETAGTVISDIEAYSYTLSGLDSSIPYDFYVRRDCSDDDQEDFGEWVGPVRFNSGHCIPYATQGFYFTLFNTTNAVENVTYSNPGPALGTGYVNTDMIITESAGETFNFTSNYVGGASGLKIWVDWNNNFVFEDDEQVYFLASTNGNKSGTITVPAGTEPGDYRMRARAQQGATANPNACGLIAQGEALDFTLRVPCDAIDAPTGNPIQQFTTGETLAHLDVTGTGIVWFADEDLTTILDENTELVDAAIYYAVSMIGNCQSEALAITVEQVANISDFNSFGFTYYPNPVSELLYLSANAPISDVTVINMLGQQVNVSANHDNTRMDMSGLPTGNYLIKVTIEGSSKTIKIVKK